MLNKMLENVRKQTPLVHCITNYVTVNDCANILLACGGSPIMADDSQEVEEITSICDGLVINIGTLNKNTIESMILAGKKANSLGRPVILDPVGAGASTLRTQTVQRLLDEIHFTVIRGNISEIKTLTKGSGITKGVDANLADVITEENLEEVIRFARDFAKKTEAIIVITGAIDLVVDTCRAYTIKNGHPMMAKVTGTGCMLTAMIGAYLATNKKQPLEATVAAICAMGLCGEIAYDKMLKNEGGNGSYRNDLIDSIYNLQGDMLERGARYEVR